MTRVASPANENLRSLAWSLMARDRQPLDRLSETKQLIQRQQTVFRELGASFSALQSLSRSFSSTSSVNPLRKMTVEGMNTDALDVRVESRASPGTHQIEILRLATTHSLASRLVSLEGEKSLAGGAGMARFSFSAGGETYEVSTEIPNDADQNEAMRLLAQAVNNAKAPVRAVILNVGSGEQRLLLQAREAGAAGRISDVQDLEGSWMRDLGLSAASRIPDAGKAGMSVGGSGVQEGTDALILVNGVEITSPSNVITDIFPGVSLTLKAGGTGPQEIRVHADETAVVETIQEFITEYNKVVSEVRLQTRAADESGENRGLMTGDVLFMRLRSVLRSAVTNPVDRETYRYLSQIGITSNRDGTLTISDNDALTAAIRSDAVGVQDLFRGESGIAGRLYDVVREYSGLTGVLGRRNETIRQRLSTLDTRIAQMNQGLQRREEALIRQLADMEATLRMLSQQQSHLGSLLSSGEQIYARTYGA